MSVLYQASPLPFGRHSGVKEKEDHVLESND